ncbi:glycoside hydrolase family 3 protein [bacterium]|nr:glycoside hydrolase family 3 protein [bacterium]
MKEIAKKLVFAFDGIEPPDGFLKFLKEEKPGGVILFERNVAGLGHLRKLTAKIHSASPESLIMIDEEGGAKSRLRRGFPNPPDPRKIASEDIHELYRIAGEALAELGIDVDLAPVVDVAPPEHILGDRPFSDDAETCAENAAAAIAGLLSAGIIPCAKHFPGLGSASIDPHIAVSVAEEDADFADKHFIPFRAAIQAGVPAIMTTHLVAKSLDSTGEIATFSRTMIDILRNDLGFSGTILSDDLFMGGAGRFDIVERAFRALSAGHDMVLLCSEIAEPRDFIEALDRRFRNSR